MEWLGGNKMTVAAELQIICVLLGAMGGFIIGYGVRQLIAIHDKHKKCGCDCGKCSGY